MDDKSLNTNPNTPTPQESAAQGSTSIPSAYSYSSIVEKYGGKGNEDTINSMYDASKASQLAGLESAYQQNLSDAQAARDKIDPAYQKSANSLATQYERNRRNLNTAAAQNGLNTGVASQQQLALNSGYQRDFGSLRENQANAIAESERNIASLKANYQAQVQQAIADNDFQRAQALMNEYNNSFTRQMQIQSLGESEAATRASYGDFSGYAAMYGQETADQMKNLWIVQNPKLAYQMGVIDQSRYNQLTGAGSSSGGGYYGGYYRTGTENDETADAAHYGISEYLTNVRNAKDSGNSAQAMEAINYGVQNGDLSSAQAKVLTDMVNAPAPNVTRGTYANQKR